MSFTYDVTTDLGLVRLIATDSDASSAIFQDAEINAFLSLQDGDVKLAAAQALDTIASSEALVQKKIRLLDLQTDGPAVAKALRDHASALRQEVRDGDAVGAFDVAEQVTNAFGRRQRIYDEWMRRLA